MSDGQHIGGLEAALLARAEKLADEYLAGGQHVRQQILTEANQRLHIEEEREVLAAKAHAERAYQQRVQAAELGLRSELDRVRWELVNSVLSSLPARLTALAKDEARYLPLLLAWLREGAQVIERDHLVVQVNARDLTLLKHDWHNHAQEAAPKKNLELCEETLDCIGGVLVTSSDGDIRYDNTFEGRMEKFSEALQGAIADQLIPTGEAHIG